MSGVLPYTLYMQTKESLQAKYGSGWARRRMGEGWNWRHDVTGRIGTGYSTQRAAREGALRDSLKVA